MESCNQNHGPESRQVLNDHRVLRISEELKVKQIRRIGTWNVRSLFEAGKLCNLIQEMKRMKVDIMGVSEVRWPEAGKCHSDDHVMYYSGNTDGDRYHRNGVGIVLTKNIDMCVMCFVPISERCLLIKLKGNPVNINLIQVYAPTLDKDDDEVETFYANIDEALKLTKSGESTIILGDFNAKIGCQPKNGIVGSYGLGERNVRGDRLFQFCLENNFTVGNTWYKLPPRRLYTWTSPQDSSERIVRNQIDYILINQRFRNAIKSIKTYPGADINSDHNPVIMQYQIKLKSCKRWTPKKNLNIRILKDNIEIGAQFADTINSNFPNTIKIDETNNTISVDDTIHNMTELFLKTAEDKLGYCRKDKKKIWMTDEILELMDKRREFKNINLTEYRATHRLIRRKIRMAKEAWMFDCCKEIEDMADRHDDFHMHKKIKEVTGYRKKSVATTLVDKDNNLILDKGTLINTWENYVRDLFGDDRTFSFNNAKDFSGPPIIREELIHAIRLGKTNKAAGPDNIYTEFIKLLDDHNIDILLKLFNEIYNSGTIPQDWLNSTFITLPKKAKAKTCNDHRLISLMSHLLKIFLKIVHNRLYKIIDEQISETQFGFRNGFGTREALVTMQLLVQKCQDQQKPVFMCFIDIEKAFDNVRHDKLMEILQEINVDGKDLRIIKNLYWSQSAQVSVQGSISNEVAIKKGVRQGCILSPLLFNIYAEYIFREALDEIDRGIKINGRILNNIRYADDTALVADSFEDMEFLLTRVNNVCKSYGLNTNAKKTKWMVVSGFPSVYPQLIVGNQVVERVNNFKYLGCILTDTWNPDATITSRIEAARSSFMKLKAILCDKNLNLELRLRMVTCYVWSVLLYGVESWTLKASTIKKLEAFEVWILRRMSRISWTQKMTNETVFSISNTEKKLLRCIKQRKTAYFGHIIRNFKYETILLVLEGKVEGNRKVGRRKVSWLKNIRDWLGVRSSSDLVHLARDREEFRKMITNLL